MIHWNWMNIIAFISCVWQVWFYVYKSIYINNVWPEYVSTIRLYIYGIQQWCYSKRKVRLHNIKTINWSLWLKLCFIWLSLLTWIRWERKIRLGLFKNLLHQFYSSHKIGQIRLFIQKKLTSWKVETVQISLLW